MLHNKAKWLIYTILIGALPMLVRLFAWMALRNGQFSPVAVPDFVYFGLVLHAVIICELERADVDVDKNWKTWYNGGSLIFAVFYGEMYTLSLLPEVFSPVIIGMLTLPLLGVSLAASYHVADKLAEKGISHV